MLNYLIEAQGGKGFDATRPYKLGQGLLKLDATWGYELWVAAGDVAAAAWNPASFTCIQTRKEKILVSDTAYTGVELGTKLYSHNIGHVDFEVTAYSSTGEKIEVFVTTKSTTKITIQSAVAYANARIYVQEIIIQ